MVNFEIAVFLISIFWYFSDFFWTISCRYHTVRIRWRPDPYEMRKTQLGYWLIHIGHFYACQLVTKCGTRMLEPLYHDWICWDILRTSLANRIADTCSRFTNIKNKMNFFQGKRSILNKISRANDFRMHSYSESWMDGNRSSSNGQIYDDFETYVPISFGFWMETLILALCALVPPL